jgi:hypothetical protein
MQPTCFQCVGSGHSQDSRTAAASWFAERLQGSLQRRWSTHSASMDALGETFRDEQEKLHAKTMQARPDHSSAIAWQRLAGQASSPRLHLVRVP